MCAHHPSAQSKDKKAKLQVVKEILEDQKTQT